MEKSIERKVIEDHIRISHEKALTLAMELVHKKYGDNLEAALADFSFVQRVQDEIKTIWTEYLKGYSQLEEIEAKEGYPAMLAYAAQLDIIGKHIPSQNKQLCYYPYSGMDLYWGRIFNRVVFDDISFDCNNELSVRWWGVDDYGADRRNYIIMTLRKLEIIPNSAVLEFRLKDADIPNRKNEFNERLSTLLLKGGSDVLDYLDNGFEGVELRYGAVITVNSINTKEQLREKFMQHNYHENFSMGGKDFIAPYAMELKNVMVFCKNALQSHNLTM